MLILLTLLTIILNPGVVALNLIAESSNNFEIAILKTSPGVLRITPDVTGTGIPGVGFSIYVISSRGDDGDFSLYLITKFPRPCSLINLFLTFYAS